ncbi:MAG: murein L,D-transpeptidase [Methylobacterium sp.]|uniref:murein L,D-transpeptidase family protein n=1 Tax=Methylobacterium sp. TaxID=409 RepID=UPI003453BB2B|nr:murein L,D-transpeptidase [Methylobacterium sp.]
MLIRMALALCLGLALASCQDGQYAASTKHLAPIPGPALALMASKGVSASDPILMRAYKKESEIELWKRGTDGRYALLKTYPMCRWSGQLGPKTREGDRQAPEGFYAITPGAMNPNSSLYLSFDVGYPNAFDKSQGRTGSHLMVHGSCSSRGCFAMTDEAISEIYAVAREAFAGGQRAFQFQSYPFRMTAENLARHRQDPHMAFWKNLKEGSDQFEVTGSEPVIAVAEGRYAFTPSGGGDASTAIARKRDEDERAVAALVAKGTPAIKLVYEDGSQHHSFRETMMANTAGPAGTFAALDARPSRGHGLGEVSRPEALAAGPQEIAMVVPTRNTLSVTGGASARQALPKPGTTKPVTIVARAGKEPDRTGLRKVVASAGDGRD